MGDMMSYYATVARIRYYGQIPGKVEKSKDAVCAAVKSTVFGANVLGTDRRASLDTAASKPVDLSHKKETAHEAFANMALDVDSLYVFTKKWGFLEADVDDQGRSVTRIEHVKPLQNLLHRAWTGDRDALEKLAKNLEARVDVTATGIDIAVVNLESLVRLLFLRDHHAGRIKVCANPDCHSPFFLQQRRGQKYCTHKCAVLMNVRRFREREAKSQSKRRPR
jgi:hypothetical protein